MAREQQFTLRLSESEIQIILDACAIEYDAHPTTVASIAEKIHLAFGDNASVSGIYARHSLHRTLDRCWTYLGGRK